ncbi:MAG TPA: NADH-quinone oxidoreductase subunit NuoH [Anaerolineales bacterium]|nr:NADH-quinone oxidoreductase subunit NuoH [Anaerolineales bacterium]
MDPIVLLANWFEGVLVGWGAPPWAVNLILSVLGIALLCTVMLLIAIWCVWVERKVVARFQDRLGPNRIGPYGLFQPFTDIIKLLIKEDIEPKGIDKVPYNIAPILALATVLTLWAIIPLSPQVLGSDINVGVLFIVAIGAISTLGIIMAGWSCNNKFALLGALREVATMISYEVPMVIALMIPVILASSMGINKIVESQSPLPYIFVIPLAAVIFLICSQAELGRAPFDLSEAESEIVAGYHIEYSGMKFGMFYAGELLHAFTVGAIFSSLFLGGWSGPFVDRVPVLGVFYLFIKSLFIYWVIMWIKYTLPRLRIDHMLSFNWKFLTPLSLALLMVVAVLHKLLQNANPWVYILGMLVGNIAVGAIALAISRRQVKVERKEFQTNRSVARPPESSPTAPIPDSGGD